MNCSHCTEKANVQCKDCDQWCCIFCALHGVHEQESHQHLPDKTVSEEK